MTATTISQSSTAGDAIQEDGTLLPTGLISELAKVKLRTEVVDPSTEEQALLDSTKGDAFSPARVIDDESDDSGDDEAGKQVQEKSKDATSTQEKLPRIDLVSKTEDSADQAAMFSSFDVLSINDRLTELDEDEVKLSSTDEVQTSSPCTL